MHMILLRLIVLASVLVAPLSRAQSNPYVSVSFGSPVNGAVYQAPATVTATASAFTIDDGVYVSQLQILQGTQVLASTNRDSTLSYTLSSLGPGSYTLRASARSNLGGTSSKSVSFTVVQPGDRPPVISLNPATGQPFIGPAQVNLSATASDPDGQVVRVDYHANGTFIGSSTSAGFGLTWANVAPGSHSVTGTATDNNGKSTTSAPITVVVEQSVIRGNIDGITQDASGRYFLRGWACSSGYSAPIYVHVYVNGSYGTGSFWKALPANQASDPSVAAACQSTGGQHRFSVEVDDGLRASHANQLVYVHGISPAGAENALLANSGLHRVPPPLNLSRRYVYDAQQRLCKVIEPETGSTVMEYDASGNLVWSASGLNLPDPNSCDRAAAEASGSVVRRTYDARNRLARLTFPDSLGNQVWSYTPDGLPSQVTTSNDAGSLTHNHYAYNKRRLLTAERLEQPGVYDGTITYTYSANGHVAGQGWPSGLLADYAPNALGQPTGVGSFASNVRYFPNGAISQFTYGNGIVHSLRQNTRQLPARSTDAGVIDFDIRYDANGNVSDVYDVALGADYDRHMTYDHLDRLVSAGSSHFGGDHWHRFGYDALDNLRSWTLAGVKDHHYWYDANNRLTNVRDSLGNTVTGLAYDVQGNLKVKNGQGYAFDHGNRLRGVDGLESYRYDAHGLRILAHVPGSGNVLSQYAQDGRLVFQSDERQGVNRDFVHLGGSLIARREHRNGIATTTYLHTDALGSPVASTDQSGQVKERTYYEPFGAAIGKVVDGPGYTGHVMDGITGLTYMQQRYYDPTIGRFLSVDPVTAYEKPMTNFNRYMYALNNPYKFTDPDGRDVVFSVDPNGAGGNGHTSLYFQDGKGNWYQYDQGAAGDGGSSGDYGFVSGRSTQAGVSIQPVDSKAVPADGLRISTTSKQDAKIADSAVKSADAHNSGKTEYNLYSNNCTDAAVDVVNGSGAGITVSNPATTVKPNSWMSEVKNDKNAVKIENPDKKR
ncbi:hypothetical protein A9K58_04770 [Stenotrophomonas maltophilia]|uniref:Teneurin-like YD-shell domain-containing protein n=1 Tax=Stenotrophomonas maltophilia TaxID=40324 RepID=A0A1A6XZQ7_STEMA|nr:RHS repeat-associated core domain-containing protein [Stenotrophomonas maltophilia]OBU69047.1 hypothetical protein A9K58_04770 [Stenotrophomonas maltophilia]